MPKIAGSLFSCRALQIVRSFSHSEIGVRLVGRLDRPNNNELRVASCPHELSVISRLGGNCDRLSDNSCVDSAN